MLVRGWRIGGVPNIPLDGTHYVRVECLVIEEGTGRVLMVAERVGAGVGVLKLVTGSVGKNEFVTEAAEREVLEEAGVRARFVGLLGIANRLRTRFEKDEMLVGVLMFAQAGQTPKADGSETERATWVAQDDAIKGASPMTVEWLMSAVSTPTPIPRTRIPDPLRTSSGQLMEICSFRK
jgi:ADP-ribose pyrophosphatase YjhB (NUDIX family)